MKLKEKKLEKYKWGWLGKFKVTPYLEIKTPIEHGNMVTIDNSLIMIYNDISASYVSKEQI